jgi:hypothetical protein
MDVVSREDRVVVDTCHHACLRFGLATDKKEHRASLRLIFDNNHYWCLRLDDLFMMSQILNEDQAGFGVFMGPTSMHVMYAKPCDIRPSLPFA